MVAVLRRWRTRRVDAAFSSRRGLGRVQLWLRRTGHVELVEAAEPADCESLDAAAAAEAAGIDVDVTDLDGTADVNLPGFWTKSCSYGNGAMSLSTLSFNAIEDAQRFYADNLDAADGVVLDVALGSLPASSLVIQTGGAAGPGSSVPSRDEVAAAAPTVQVAVFEAPVPFSVTFTGDDIDPTAVVAAAEAVLAALVPTPEPPPTDVATTVVGWHGCRDGPTRSPAPSAGRRRRCASASATPVGRTAD